MLVLAVDGARHVAASTCRPDPLTLVDSTTGSIDSWTACGCIDHPKCQRPRVVRVIEWRGTPYLLVGRDRSVFFASLEDAARPGILRNASVGVSEVGDDEATIRNVVACDDCRVAMLAGRADSAVWQWGDGEPLETEVGTPWVPALGASGGFTWRQAGTQYLVTDRLAADVAGCHPSVTTSAPVVYRVSPGLSGPTWDRVGCADAGGAGWQVFDGERVGGELWLRAITGQVYRFALESGGRLRYVEPDPIRGAREGFDVDDGVIAAVSPSGSTPVSLAGVSDPDSVVATVAGTMGHQVLALGHGALLSSDVDGASLHDLSDLELLADIPNRVTAACEETSSIAFHPTEPVAYLARMATLQAVDLGSCLGLPEPLFASGFESGDLARWSVGG
jgi:hypothetical protein